MDRLLIPKKYYLYFPTEIKRRIINIVGYSLFTLIWAVSSLFVFCSAFKSAWGIIPALLPIPLIAYVVMLIFTGGYFYISEDNTNIIVKRKKMRDTVVSFSSIKELRYKVPKDSHDRAINFFPLFAVYNHTGDILFYVCQDEEVIKLFRSHNIPCHKGT